MAGSASSLREQLHEIIFEADTPAGKAFDLVLLGLILISVTTVILESVAGIRAGYGGLFRMVEWAITILFTVEYALRLYCVGRPWRYALSFYGLVDLAAILPTYLSLVVGGAHSLAVIRALRLLRVFRILKLGHFVDAASTLGRALKASRRKIMVFVGAVATLVLIIGSVMYLVEGEENGFTSIPLSIYWAVVTLTTVGYGDIAPQTVFGKALASLVMIIGYGIIAVPTGIVTVEMSRLEGNPAVSTQACPQCGKGGHDPDAAHCKHCGSKL